MTVSSSFQSIKANKDTYFSALRAEARTSVLTVSNGRMEISSSCVALQILCVPLLTAHRGTNLALSQSCHIASWPSSTSCFSFITKSVYRGMQLLSAWVLVLLLREEFYSVKSHFDTVVPKPEEQDSKGILLLTFSVGFWVCSCSVSWLFFILLLEHLPLPIQLLWNLSI